MKPLRIYIDTSVIGGCYDKEFSEDSNRLIAEVRRGHLVILVSELVLIEIADAPEKVRAVLNSVPVGGIEVIRIESEIISLRDAYLDADIVGERFRNDATHVAAATVARADAIISWNFKHIVRLDKIRAYNQINLLNGYGILTILTPKEVATRE